MCVTNIYVDRYPDGREVEFHDLSTCQYGSPGRPCHNHSIQESPPRRIAYNEPSTQYMFNQYPATPPRSDSSSQHRHSRTSHKHSRSRSDSDRERDYRLSTSKRGSLKPTRQHRKERIVIVDAPPTPTTPPQLFASTFSAPSSPDPKGRPIIVDERRTHSPPRHGHHTRHGWDTPSSSHTSFDLRAEREREDRAARRREEREAELDDELRRARRIYEANEDIKRRQAIPIPPPALKDRAYRRERQVTIDQGEELQRRLGALTLGDRMGEMVVVDEKRERREREKKDREVKARLEKAEEEAMRQRLRERQLPRRRFTVGPGHRRHRVLYDDGVYRWE